MKIISISISLLSLIIGIFIGYLMKSNRENTNLRKYSKCHFNYEKVVEMVNNGWNINSNYRLSDGSLYFPALTASFGGVCTEFDDKLSLFYLKSGGMISLPHLRQMIK